jgi:hypothetical protein
VSTTHQLSAEGSRKLKERGAVQGRLLWGRQICYRINICTLNRTTTTTTTTAAATTAATATIHSRYSCCSWLPCPCYDRQTASAAFAAAAAAAAALVWLSHGEYLAPRLDVLSANHDHHDHHDHHDQKDQTQPYI